MDFDNIKQAAEDLKSGKVVLPYVMEDDYKE